jgi:DNA polymerase III alpha subunit
MVVGRPESSGDSIKLHIDSVTDVESVKPQLTRSIKIILDYNQTNQELIQSFKLLFAKHSGQIPVILQVNENGSKPRSFYLKEYRVAINDELLKALKKIIGEENIILCT